MVVVDASVVVKWYIPEKNYEEARELRDDYLNDETDLFSPELLPFEVMNALLYTGEFDTDDLQEVEKTLPKYGINLVPFSSIDDVVRIASDTDTTVYDASYIGLASDRETVAYTSDTKLIRKLEGTEYESKIEHVKNY